MNQQHTPGPWQFDGECTIFQQDDSGVEPILFKLYDSDCIIPLEQLANAHLIAAAPELLEALKECQNQLAGLLAMGHLRGNETINLTSAVNLVAKKAIAKAQGQNTARK